VKTSCQTHEAATGGARSLDELLLDIEAVTADAETANRIVSEVAAALHQIREASDSEQLAHDALAALLELKPGNLLELMLAAQTIICHETAIYLLAAARDQCQQPEDRHMHVLCVASLAGVFLNLAEASQKRGNTSATTETVEALLRDCQAKLNEVLETVRAH